MRNNWHRYYDPQLGRYLSTDPIGIAGGDLNLYGYVANDPIDFIDPEGTEIFFFGRTPPFIRPSYRLAPSQRPMLRPQPKITPEPYVSPKPPVPGPPPPIEELIGPAHPVGQLLRLVGNHAGDTPGHLLPNIPLQQCHPSPPPGPSQSPEPPGPMI